jgi:pyrroline-5-carboxylate reductase
VGIGFCFGIDGDVNLVNSAGASTGAKLLIDMTPGIAATTTSTATIPAGSRVVRLYVNVTAAYSAGATLAVGQAGTLGLLVTGLDLTQQILNDIGLLVAWGASALSVVATISGAPAAGTCEILVESGPVST